MMWLWQRKAGSFRDPALSLTSLSPFNYKGVMRNGDTMAGDSQEVKHKPVIWLLSVSKLFSLATGEASDKRYQSVSRGVDAVAKWVKLSWLLYIWSNSLLMCLGSGRQLLKHWTPCHTHGTPAWSSWLPALVWPTPGLLWPRGEWPSRWKISVSLPFYHFHINK